MVKKDYKHIHHAYIGIILIVWSILAMHGIALIGKYNPLLAFFSLCVGVLLVIHDVLWHLSHKHSK